MAEKPPITDPFDTGFAAAKFLETSTGTTQAEPRELDIDMSRYDLVITTTAQKREYMSLPLEERKNLAVLLKLTEQEKVAIDRGNLEAELKKRGLPPNTPLDELRRIILHEEKWLWFSDTIENHRRRVGSQAVLFVEPPVIG